MEYSKKEWKGFVHLLARRQQNYRKAIVEASKRKRGRGIDIDARESAEHTLWALHWPTVGKNKLRDPQGLIGPGERINLLTDEEIKRLEYRGSHRTPNRIEFLLKLAYAHKVRVEVELKEHVGIGIIRLLLVDPVIRKMNAQGLLQFKTLALRKNPIAIMRAAHRAGGVTILSFTGYRGNGINRDAAERYVDYYRGRAKWL